MELAAVADIPEVGPGDDLARLIRERTDLEPGDVLTVASTVVSKAEGRHLDLASVEPGERAVAIAEQIGQVTGEQKDPRFAQAVLEESAEVLLESPFLLTVTHFGHVCVNAGIDRSNVPRADLLLLPDNPSASAQAIRDGLETEDVGVVVTDTCGRPFRHGQRGVAIGWAGLPASRDWRGETDRDGRRLDVAVESIIDEIAAAGNLLAGEGDGGRPVVRIRGFEVGDHDGSDALFRSEEDDLVRQALREWGAGS